MVANAYQSYQNNMVMTATPGDLTLMLYNGCIKVCNQAKEALENKDMNKAHIYITKAQDIVVELQSTLDTNYPVGMEMDRLYTFILEHLIEANTKKDMKKLTEAQDLVREFRDVWQEATKGMGAKGIV